MIAEDYFFTWLGDDTRRKPLSFSQAQVGGPVSAADAYGGGGQAGRAGRSSPSWFAAAVGRSFSWRNFPTMRKKTFASAPPAGNLLFNTPKLKPELRIIITGRLTPCVKAVRRNPNAARKIRTRAAPWFIPRDIPM